MLLITCPVCTVTAAETEFSCGGLYSSVSAAAPAYTRGVAREWWLCEAGCGSWFGMARHTGNQRILATWVRGQEPPLFAGEVS